MFIWLVMDVAIKVSEVWPDGSFFIMGMGYGMGGGYENQLLFIYSTKKKN